MTEKACFALACFWQPDAQFGCQKGVLQTRVGYCGGKGPAPNYPSVNDHTEAVEITYDPSIISYEDLLRLFWQFHDPCSCKKRQYMSAIFYSDEQQRRLAEDSKKHHESELEKQVATQILALNIFHEAEDYHQKYFLRTYHRNFYGGLPKHDPVTSTRDSRLNGYLSGHGNVEDMEKDEYLSELTEEQLQYVRNHMTGEHKAPTVEPFIRTVIQVGWNFVKKAVGL
ncbi:peptide methionine sulfoxide reductase MsrA-like isoform X1 [Argiope bruennichi]|uniref:peptide methionine sulfoxide reductase MsrA-like isoform X1 n=1 Tax=Argiope bruennichi TaxID=94029 RepID=UPI002494F949|nr:peptide methionine sulfoxide reductase MsrA-like isoform X1 [Argiope bruennichi]